MVRQLKILRIPSLTYILVTVSYRRLHNLTRNWSITRLNRYNDNAGDPWGRFHSSILEYDQKKSTGNFIKCNPDSFQTLSKYEACVFHNTQTWSLLWTNAEWQGATNFCLLTHLHKTCFASLRRLLQLLHCKLMVRCKNKAALVTINLLRLLGSVVVKCGKHHANTHPPCGFRTHNQLSLVAGYWGVRHVTVCGGSSLDWQALPATGAARGSWCDVICCCATHAVKV